MLHLNGLETLVASSAQQGLQLLEEHGDMRIGRVISDLCLPDHRLRARVSVNSVLAKLGVSDRANAAVRALAIGRSDP